MKANLFIIVAPSGAGKTSLVRALVSRLPSLQISISHTTRAPRPAEIHGIDYFFLDKQSFQNHIDQALFLEYATVHGNFYGTSKEWVRSRLNEGIDIVLEIDWQGARQIRTLFPDAVSIFILPPSLPVLEQRLRTRAQDNEAVIQLRLQAAKEELRHYSECKYLVVNEDFLEAVSKLEAIVNAERQLCPREALRQKARLAHLLES